MEKLIVCFSLELLQQLILLGSLKLNFIIFSVLWIKKIDLFLLRFKEGVVYLLWSVFYNCSNR